jgi:hypothetical protein
VYIWDERKAISPNAYQSGKHEAIPTWSLISLGMERLDEADTSLLLRSAVGR